MGLLGDIFSEIDRKKRQLRGLLSDPAETIYQGIRNFGAEQQGLLDTQARAYPWTGGKDAKPDLAARKALADAGAAQGMAAATVWHGSPHKFDKFDSSKIGTGEGAQAYGHGLYLAESPQVAGQYRDMLSGKTSAGASLNMDDPAQVASMRLHQFQGDKDAAIQWITERRPNPKVSAANAKAAASADAQIDAIRKGYANTSVDGGQLYKVDLPDEHIAKMLDWDKPLSQQAPEVQAALMATKNKQLRAVVDYASSPYSTPGLEGEVKTMGEAIKLLGMNASPAKGSAMLAKQGIPGIRYLDGGSRGAGTGTSNYVVFPGNEDILKILERNGQGLLGP